LRRKFCSVAERLLVSVESWCVIEEKGIERESHIGKEYENQNDGGDLRSSRG